MNKKSKEIVKKLCFTLVIVISIITIIGCPNTVSNKTDSGTGSNGSNPPSPPPPLPDPWKITVEGAGTNIEVKVCLKKWDSDPEKDLELSLTEAESKLKEWIEGSAGDDTEIEVTFIVKNHEEGDCLEISEDFQLDKDNPNKAKLKYSKKNYPKNGIKLSFKKVQGYFDMLKFEKDDPIVTDYRGLGFGNKDGKLCHLAYNGSNHINVSFNEARSTIMAQSADWDGYPPETPEYFYPNFKEGLKKRWFAASVTKEYSTGPNWLDPVTNSNDDLNSYLGSPGKTKLTYHIIPGSYICFAVDVSEGKLFTVADTSAVTYFADWQLVFVPNDGAPAEFKSYSFHYGPYVLRNRNENDDLLVPGDIDDQQKVHMFTLSGMLKDYLRIKKRIFVHSNGTESFVPFKDKDKYDVYLIIGNLYRSGSSTFFCYKHVHRSFRNVLKLNDKVFWGKCWN